MRKIKALIRLMRPKHWIKNFLLFIPLFCSLEVRNINSVLKTLEGFMAFSIISSVVYIVNDIADEEKDRNHPIKCKRPIASGEVKKKDATFLAAILFISALLINECIFGFSYREGLMGTLIIVVYFIINMIYSFVGKNIPILDVTLLMSGFVIRAIYGCVIINVSMSHWLYLTILSFAYYMGLGKRRGELRINGSTSRKVLQYYTIEFLNNNMQMFMTLTLIFYSLWTIDKNTVERVGNNLFVWSVPIVILICLKYNMDIEKSTELADPIEVLFEDKILLALGVLFIIFVFIIFL